LLQNASQQEFTSSDKQKYSNSLTIIHHNVRGLSDNIDELICSQTSNNINRFICLSEHSATELNLLTLNLENYYSAFNFSCTVLRILEDIHAYLLGFTGSLTYLMFQSLV
jgi:hypothetical protein